MSSPLLPRILKIKLICAVFCILASVSSFAQERSINQSYRINVALPLSKSFSIALEEDIRPTPRYDAIEFQLATFWLRYAPSPHFNAGAAYTSLSFFQQDKYLHRYLVYAEGALMWKGINFSIRERYQNTFPWGTYRNNTDVPNHVLRIRTRVAYPIKKLKIEPFAFVEMFNLLKAGMPIGKIRFSAGCAYKLNKKSRFQVYFRNHYFGVSEVLNYSNSIGIGYFYTL